ncbi:MAG: MBG domain-containing protein, partial [Niabella sp.]
NESFFGAALDVESTAKTVFFNSTVRGNVATTNSDGYTGGIINAGKGRSDFYNNVFTGNTGFTSVFQANTIISFVNNTVWNDDPDAGIFIIGNSIKLYNNILEDILGPGTSAEVQNNAFRYTNNYTNKNNNVSESNPYFADAASFDFSLTGCSPIINKGNNTLYSFEYNNIDILGNSRKLNTIDIGAYENILGTTSKTKPTVVSSQVFCGAVTLNDLQVTGENIKWYGQASGGSPLANTTALTSGSTYYVSQTVNGCESDRASVAVTLSTTEAPTVQSPQNFTVGQTNANIVVSGNNLKWYTQETGGTATTTAPALNLSSVNTATYWVSQTNANGCESTRTQIVVNVTKIPLIVTADDKSKIYDGNVYGTTNFTVSYSGFKSGDDASNSIFGTLTFSGSAVNATETGTYSNQIIPQGITSDKYTIEFKPGTLKILPDANAYTDNTMYVKQGNIGGDGSSWELAFNDLSTALKDAKLLNDGSPGTINKIYVAKGTYSPKHSARDGANFANEGKDNSFVLVNGVKLYGGFDGIIAGESLANRDIQKNKTILDGTDFNYHVVTVSNSLGDNLIDGFTIRKGKAEGTGTITVNGKIINRGQGGGIVVNNSNLTIKNGIVLENSSSAYPSGSSIDISTQSTVSIYNALFYKGSGTHLVSVSGLGSNLKVVNSTFSHYSYYFNLSDKARLEIYNSILNNSYPFPVKKDSPDEKCIIKNSFVPNGKLTSTDSNGNVKVIAQEDFTTTNGYTVDNTTFHAYDPQAGSELFIDHESYNFNLKPTANKAVNSCKSSAKSGHNILKT